MPVYERISALVSLTLLGLLFLLVIDLPSRELSFIILGSPLSLQLSTRWLMAFLLTGIACAGTEGVVRLHPANGRGELSHTFLFWILPGLLSLVAALLVPLAPARWLWAGGIAATGVLLGGTVLAEYHTIDPLDRRYELSRRLLTFVAYLVTLVLFVIVYQSRTRSVVSATAMLLFGGLMALELLHRLTPASPDGRTYRLTWIYAALVGLLMGEATWAMNYWRIGGLGGGLLLLLLFYFLTGLVQQRLLGRITWKTLAEYALVAALGVFLTFQFAV